MAHSGFWSSMGKSGQGHLKGFYLLKTHTRAACHICSIIRWSERALSRYPSLHCRDFTHTFVVLLDFTHVLNCLANLSPCLSIKKPLCSLKYPYLAGPLHITAFTLCTAAYLAEPFRPAELSIAKLEKQLASFVLFNHWEIQEITTCVYFISTLTERHIEKSI